MRTEYWEETTEYLSRDRLEPRVIVTPAVYPRLFELLHFDIQSTGQKSRCVNTGRRPSHCSVLIKQSDSPCPFSVLDRYLLHDAPPIFPRARLPLSPSARRSRKTASVPAKGRSNDSALAISPSASGRTSRKSGSISAYLESQSFFRSYGSILPTSLVCIVRYRPEATRLGDLLRSIGTRSHEIQLHLPGFSRDGSEAPDDAQHGRRFSAAPPTASPLDAIPRSTYFWRPYQEKRALPGLLSHRLRGCLRRRQAPDRANGPKANLRVEARESMPDSLSVGQGRARAHRVALAVPAVSRHLAATLRRGYTTIDRRSRGTLLHFGLRGFRLNVCYYHQDLHRRPLRPSSRPGLRRDRRARLLERACVARSLSCLVVHAFDGARARRSSAIHFQGRSIRQVSRYTFLSGCRLPWPPTCCLYRSTPFVGSDERRVGRLVSAFGSSRIASPAYQEWPTRQKKSSSAGGLFPASRRRSAVHELRNASAFCAPSRRLPIESSRIGRGLFVPDRLASASFSEQLSSTSNRSLYQTRFRVPLPAILRETSAGTSY